MPSRIFVNVNNLPRQTICERLLPQDPLVIVDIYDADILQNGRVSGTTHYCKVDSTSLTDDAVNLALSTIQTAQEMSDINDYIASRAAFLNLPNWANWTSQQASDYVTNNILNGMTQAQVTNYINTTAINLAGVVTVLQQIGTTLLTIRTILVGLAQAIVFIRNLIIHFRPN